MKKTLLLATLLAAGFGANAQKITDGSLAPNISGQRIISVNDTTDEVTYGELISVQAYLDAGKTVVMDGSATWCGPCWSMHNAKVLDNLYAAFGPEGSDELRVIFVEADPSTAVSELGGKNQAPLLGMPERGNPQGNWLTDVPYPVINSDDLVKSVANGGYGLNAYPSMYVIVPSGTVGEPGKVYNLAWDDLGKMTAVINTARATTTPPMAAMVGVDYYGKVQATDLRYCEAEGDIRGYVTSTFGHAITSVQVQLKKDGEILETKDFTVNLGGYATGAVDFTGFTLDGAADYQMVLTKVNGQDPLAKNTGDFTSEEFKVFPSASVESGKNITATLHTDSYPEEIQFGIYNSAGDFVYISPLLQATAANRNKTFTYNVNPTGLLDPIDCYGVILADGYGDGWVEGTGGPYGLTITSANRVLFTTNGEFEGQQVAQDATFKTNGLLGNESFETSSFAVYPNPSNGVFNFNTKETISVTVVDITGKTVHTAKGIENGGSINLSGLQAGIYIAKINGASGERNEKLIIK